MSEDDRQEKLYARFFEVAVRDAMGKHGDRKKADQLILAFADLATDPQAFDQVGGIPPALVQYIASCLLEWRNGDYSDAIGCFNLKRRAHGPKREIDGRHIRALREYRIQRLVKKTIKPDALERAAELSGLSEGQVRALVQDQSDADKKDEILEVIAMEGITLPSDSTAPCLPRKTKGKSSR